MPTTSKSKYICPRMAATRQVRAQRPWGKTGPLSQAERAEFVETAPTQLCRQSIDSLHADGGRALRELQRKPEGPALLRSMTTSGSRPEPPKRSRGSRGPAERLPLATAQPFCLSHSFLASWK
jgi:hypothetical protein